MQGRMNFTNQGNEVQQARRSKVDNFLYNIRREIQVLFYRMFPKLTTFPLNPETLKIQSLGIFEIKNIQEPMNIFALRN